MISIHFWRPLLRPNRPVSFWKVPNECYGWEAGMLIRGVVGISIEVQ
jgi:hypothetical protein